MFKRLTYNRWESELKRKREKEGLRVKITLKYIKRITAAGIVRYGAFSIGKNIKDGAKKKQQVEEEHHQKQEDWQRSQMLQKQLQDEKKQVRQEQLSVRVEKQ